jgi:hypothetical protein
MLTQEQERMVSFLEKQGYSNVRPIEGGYVGLTRLLYTTGLCVGLDHYGYESRYCYGDRSQAERACNAMKDVDDEPMLGYVANRSR